MRTILCACAMAALFASAAAAKEGEIALITERSFPYLCLTPEKALEQHGLREANVRVIVDECTSDLEFSVFDAVVIGGHPYDDVVTGKTFDLIINMIEIKDEGIFFFVTAPEL